MRSSVLGGPDRYAGYKGEEKAQRAAAVMITHTHTLDERGEGTGFNLLWKKKMFYHFIGRLDSIFSVGNSYMMVNPSPVAVRCDSRGGMRRRRRAAGGRNDDRRKEAGENISA